MNILITGAGGFIGKNLACYLAGHKILTHTRADSLSSLAKKCASCDLIYHLASVIRTENESDFDENRKLCEFIAEKCAKSKKKPRIVFTSSLKAGDESAYGASKLECEEILRASGLEVFILRLPNIFGKWSRPYHNSAVATFAYNIARGYEIRIWDKDEKVKLLHIDTLCKKLSLFAQGQTVSEDELYGLCFERKLSRIVYMLNEFDKVIKDGVLPDIRDEFSRLLFSTYISFLPKERLFRKVDAFIDERGFFAELYKGFFAGQLSVNSCNAGFVKGRHFHNLKTERFVVLGGEGYIKLRDIYEDEVISFKVGGGVFSIEIPAGFTHSIEAIGSSPVITIIWADEIYDSKNPDTYLKEV